jgi:thioredoxin-related protein
MKKLIFAALAPALLVMAQDELTWLDANEGLTKAKEEGKILLVDYYTDWCGWCKVMDDSTYKDPRVIETLEEYFVLAKINPEKDGAVNYQGKEVSAEEFAQIGGTRGYPNTGFFASDGDFLGAASGFLPPDAFLEALEFYRSDKAEKMDFDSYRVIAMANELREKYDDAASLQVVYGLMMLEVEEEEEAVAAFERALEVDESYDMALLALAQHYEEIGETDRMNERLEQAGKESTIGWDAIFQALAPEFRKYYEQEYGEG